MNSSRRQASAGQPAGASVQAAGASAHPAELTASGDRIMEVVPRAMRGIREAMRSAAPPTLTVVQLRALSFVAREPGSALSPLAEHLGMSLPSASALVDRLVRGGLVDRDTDPAERRRVRLGLTDAGEARVRVARRAARAWLRQRLAGLGADELAQLDAALDLLVRIGVAPTARPRLEIR